MRATFSIILFSMVSVMAYGQRSQLIQKKIFVNPDKTTFLIFNNADGLSPDSLVYFDVGSDMVGYAKTKQSNIAKIKPASKGFAETNLTILTQSGQYYSFLVNYAAKPDTLNYFFKSTATDVQPVKAVSEKKAIKKDEGSIEEQIIGRTKNEVTKYGLIKYKIALGLTGIYIKDKTLYFHLVMFNKSTLPFDVDFVMFSVQDRKKLKASSNQDGELSPTYTFPSSSFTLDAKSEMKHLIQGFDQFTIDKDKKLVIEIWEKNNNRKISIELNSSDILNAKQL